MLDKIKNANDKIMRIFIILDKNIYLHEKNNYYLIQLKKIILNSVKFSQSLQTRL